MHVLIVTVALATWQQPAPEEPARTTPWRWIQDRTEKVTSPLRNGLFQRETTPEEPPVAGVEPLPNDRPMMPRLFKRPGRPSWWPGRDKEESESSADADMAAPVTEAVTHSEPATEPEKSGRPSFPNLLNNRIFGWGRNVGEEPSDALLVSRSRSALYDQPQFTHRVIHVSAENGTVTLRGTVGDETDRLQAESLVRSIEGVRAVRNELTTTVALTPIVPAAPANANVDLSLPPRWEAPPPAQQLRPLAPLPASRPVAPTPAFGPGAAPPQFNVPTPPPIPNRSAWLDDDGWRYNPNAEPAPSYAHTTPSPQVLPAIPSSNPQTVVMGRPEYLRPRADLPVVTSYLTPTELTPRQPATAQTWASTESRGSGELPVIPAPPSSPSYGYARGTGTDSSTAASAWSRPSVVSSWDRPATVAPYGQPAGDTLPPVIPSPPPPTQWYNVAQPAEPPRRYGAVGGELQPVSTWGN